MTRGANLTEQLGSITRSGFRLEGRQVYDVSAEVESIQAWRDGKPRPERSVRTNSYLQQVARQVLEGADRCRVRVVEQPLSEYTRYQLQGYVETQAAGERVLLVDRELVDEGDLELDYWLLDAGSGHTRAVLMHYDEQGHIIDRELVTDRERLLELAQRRERVEALAVPLNMWLAQQRSARV